MAWVLDVALVRIIQSPTTSILFVIDLAHCVRSTGSQERWTKQKQSQTKDQIENVDLFKETNKVNICSRENVRTVKRQLRCNHDKNKKEHKNSVFVEGNKDKIKLERDKINIRKNRKRENNTRGKIQQRKRKEREKEQ